ncbi:MAG: glycosyltransferase family 4 protein [Rhodobacteraceae bacterium]|nr:glycosyltransferase family 4 protein [Paracoccaceae bacterium]
MSNASILHLTDDTTPGGVMRVIDTILSSRYLAKTAKHRMAVVENNRLTLPEGGVDVIVSHLALNWRNFAARARFRAMHPNIPMIHVEHSYTQGFVAQKVLNKTRFFAMLRSAFCLFDRVIAVSNAQKDWLIRRDLIDEDRLSVIRSSVELAGFEALPRPPKQVRVFGLVGRLHEQKGFDIAIQAFRECSGPDLRLKVYGDGPLRAELEALAYCDPRITFYGHCDDPLEPMRSIDALLMPSRWEAYGLVAREAMSAGRKVIVATTDGLQDHIRSGAIEVHDHSISAWSQAITNAVQTLDKTRDVEPDKKSDHAQTASCFEYDWEKCLQNI